MTKRNQEGFTLLEVLLSIAIFGFIALGLVQMSQDYIHNKRSVVAAEHMKMIHTAAYSYLMNNFENIYNDHLGGEFGAGSLFVPIEDDGSSPHYLKRDEDLLPASFNARSPFGQTVVVLFRNAGNRNVEIVCISTGRPMTEKQVETAALLLGGYGGFWSAIDRDPGAGTTVDSVIGAYGMWSVPVAGLTTPAWPAGDSPTVQEGSYLASYQWINYPNEIGDYLYRIALPLAPEANRMMTAINMNNYNIDGIDDLSVDGTLQVRTSAAFIGSATVLGTANIGEDLTVVSDVDTPPPLSQTYVEKSTTVEGSLDVILAINANNFTRDTGNVDSTDIIVGSNVIVSGAVTNIGEVNAEEAEASALTLEDADMLAVSLVLVDTGASGGQIIVPGTIETNIINGGTITTSGMALTETLSGSGTTTIRASGGTGTIGIDGDSVINGPVRIGDAPLNPGQFTCVIGC